VFICVLESHALLPCVLVVDVLPFSHNPLPRTHNRTYIRSLIRDIGYEVDSVATTTFLERYVLMFDSQVAACRTASIYYTISHYNYFATSHSELSTRRSSRHDRTQQSQFSLEDSLERDDWTADNIYAAIDRLNAIEDS
jgi:tRNA U55 pseudouridine synthase TruB